MVKDIAFFAYSVRDVPKAIAFYRDILGLTPGELFSDHWAEFNVGGVAFGVGNGEPLGYEPGKSFGVSFEVDDIDAVRGKLVAHGLETSETKDFPNCRAVFSQDPEGNKFSLHQRK